MISMIQLTFFSAAVIVLIFTSGPDINYFITRAMALERRVVRESAIGFGLGGIWFPGIGVCLVRQGCLRIRFKPSQGRQTGVHAAESIRRP